MDGSLTSLLSRFIYSHTLVRLDLVSTSASCALLDQCPPSVLCKQMTETDIRTLSLNTLVLYYNLARKRFWQQRSPFKRRPKGRPDDRLYPLDCSSRHAKRWYLTRLRTLFYFNFVDFNSQGMEMESVDELEIRLREESPTSFDPQRVLLRRFPSYCLHVTFESSRLPIIEAKDVRIPVEWPTHPYSVKSFVLQNANWSPSNPYGPPGRSFAENEEDEEELVTWTRQYIIIFWAIVWN